MNPNPRVAERTRLGAPKGTKGIPAAADFFSLDASSGILATASASAPALFLDSALCCCGVSCML